MKHIYNITILWGTDGFGKWLTEYILKNFSHNVVITVTWRNTQKWEKVSHELWVSFCLDNIQAVKNADIIIYSVPISLTEQIILQTLPFIKPGAIVADVTSIKKFPSKAMRMRDDIIVIPTHPMFGPYISSIAWQVFVLTPEENTKSRPEYIFLKTFLENAKAKVIESTPVYHDKMMAIVQWLTHLNMFVVWETMKRLGFNIADSMDFISPIYKLMVSSVGRYLGQNPWLYADIQMYNDEVLEVHEKFLDTANNFHNSVKNKDYDTFCSDIVSAREFLWEENCQQWQEYTDKVIYMLWAQIDLLKNNIWNTIELKNIYSGEISSGILEKYENWEIFFKTGKIYKIDTHEILTP
jgi:prephenate dehydrogenase